MARLTQEELRAKAQAGGNRILAWIDYQAKKNPTSLFADRQFAVRSLVPAYWWPEEYQKLAPAEWTQFLRDKKIDYTGWFSKEPNFIAELLQNQELPSYDIEVLGSYDPYGSDQSETYRVVRSGDQILYFYGTHPITKEEILMQSGLLHDMADQMETLANLGSNG